MPDRSAAPSGSTPDPPPLGTYNDAARTCTRMLDGELCGKPAAVHVIYWWDEEPVRGAGYDHGYCCAGHWVEYQAQWKAAGHHALNAACGMPGSRIFIDEPCRFDDLPTAEPVRAIAKEIPA